MAMRARIWLTGIGFALIACTALALALHQRHEEAHEAADRGMLTGSQYAQAATIARAVVAQNHATGIKAVAYLTGSRGQVPGPGGACASNRYLVVSLVGTFPNIQVSPAPGTPNGPDTWYTVKADPTTGQWCKDGVSQGRFTTPALSANLNDAL
jgi:hypothetical protein